MIPVARKVWLQTRFESPAEAARRFTISRALLRLKAVGERVGLADGRAEEGALLVAGDACCLDIGIKIGFGVVVRRNLVELAALLVKPEPPTLSVPVVVFDLHRDDRSDAGKREDHHAMRLGP